MLITLIILALLVGLACGYLFGQRRGLAQIGNLQTTTALAEQRQSDLAQQLSSEKNQTDSLRQQLTQSQTSFATMQAQLDAARQNLLEQRKSLDEAQGTLKQAFASVSAEALAKNNEAFLQLARERFATISAQANGSLDQRKEQIEGMLKPLRELMEQYQLRVSEIEKSRVESYSMLREQLGTLAETQRTLNTQTSQLVTALSRPTVRGQWGEITLRRLVELAGLSDKCDFVEQQSVDGDQGRSRPDMVVNLPGGRDIVIDCKTTLDAFLDAAAATDQDIRKTFLQKHAQQVRNRARELSAKSYWSQFTRSPEFVVMFLPGEAFLYAAVEQDTSLIEDCLKNHVILATPTTLVALLKSIEYGWRQEAITQNAEKIRELAMEMYERMGIVLGHMAKVGSNLKNTVESYNSALGSLESRVIATARKIGELGAKTDKELTTPVEVDVIPREVRPALLGSE